MRIREIKTYTPRVPSTGGRHQLMVKVETDEGLYGWGESGLTSRELAVLGAIKHFSELLIGRDPLHTGAIWQELYRSNYFEGGRVLTAAISAIDIALHDLKGRALGVPVYQLLGGRQRDHVPLFATTSARTLPELLDQARLLTDGGWRVIRTGMWQGRPGGRTAAGEPIFEPRESVGTTAAYLTKLREAVGPDVVLGIDYHHRLSVAEAASFCQRMPAGTLDFLEEPIRAESPEAYAALRTMTDVPFAIGEEFSSKWAFLPFVDQGLTQFARVDVCNVGGLTEAMKVAGWCEAHYIDLMPHNPLGAICSAATAHLCTAVPNLAWMEIRESPTEQLGFYDRDLFPEQCQLDGPRLIVSDRPGLGVEVDEQLAARESVAVVAASTPRRRFLRRGDGSITNA
jgi:galactonate dehydratase